MATVTDTARTRRPMAETDWDTELCAIHVHWSESEAAYIARSDRHPGVTKTDRWSSLAAMNGLLDILREQDTRTPSRHQPHRG